jgi:hypothetical protein
MIEFKKFFYDDGDKKAFGRLTFEAKTPLGLLAVQGEVNHHNEFEGRMMTLDGEDVTWIDEFPKPCLKHFLFRDKSIDEKEKVREAIEEWLNLTH